MPIALFRTAAAGLAAILFVALPVAVQAAETAWDDIVVNVFDERPMEKSGIVELEAPYRAEDAAVVPMKIRFQLAPGDARFVKQVTLVVDANPAPVAATFMFGKSSGVSEIATRVRVDSYTPVHAVAELSDGTLHVAEVYVKAAGGCAAPSVKDPAAAMASLGKMKLRQFGATPDGRREAQLMISHPNNSGLQRDPQTLYYIPARFVRDLKIQQGDETIMTMEGGISISENPSFRFTYRPNSKPITAEAIDTDDKIFDGTWPIVESAS